MRLNAIVGLFTCVVLFGRSLSELVARKEGLPVFVPVEPKV